MDDQQQQSPTPEQPISTPPPVPPSTPPSSPPSDSPPDQPSDPSQNQPHEMSHDTKTIIVVLLLLLFMPLGLVMMWVWMKWWPKWVKLLITIPLLIIPILAIIMAFSLIAVDPAGKLSQAYDTQRQSDINAIMNAVSQYEVETGAIPTNISSQDSEISKNGADICADLIPTYLSELPYDPKSNTESETDLSIQNCEETYSTGYFIRSNEDGTVTVSAPHAEATEPISITQ